MSRVSLGAKRAYWLTREHFRWRKYRWYKDRSKRADRVALRKKWFRSWTQAHLQRMSIDTRIRAAETPAAARGVDVSNNQGHVDFAAVKAAGYSFAWVKATEGQGYIDPYFRQNVEHARAAHLKVGAYHFMRPKLGRTGAAEAHDFVAQIKAAGLGKGDLLPVCDIEASELKPLATEVYVEQFLTAVQKATGHRPLVYTYPAFIGWHGAHSTGLWIANYGVKRPALPAAWKSYVAWQHSSTARVPGVNGNCDVNVAPDLRRLIA